MLQLRKEYYANRVKEKPSQKKYLNGWNYRTDNLYNILKEYNENLRDLRISGMCSRIYNEKNFRFL